MNRPTWALAVGIFGIIIGCSGLIGSGQTVMMPAMYEMQRQMYTNMSEEMKAEHARRIQKAEKEAGTQAGGPAEGQSTKTGKDEDSDTPPIDMLGFMDKLWSFPPWYKTWSIAAGITGLFVSGFYILASIFILLVKRRAIVLFYWAAGISICFSLVKGVVGVMANPMIGISMMVWSVISIVFSVVLIIVVATSDKQAFGYAPPRSQTGITG